MITFYFVTCLVLGIVIATTLSGLLTVTVEHFFDQYSDGLLPCLAGVFGLFTALVLGLVMHDQAFPSWALVLACPVGTVLFLTAICALITGFVWLVISGVSLIIGHFRNLGIWLRELAHDYRFHRNIENE